MKKIFKIILFIFTITITNPVFANSQNPLNSTLTTINYEDIREQAKILYMGNQPQTAQKHINSIPEENKTAFDYYLIGLTEKDNSKAIKSYQKATKIDETFYQAYYNMAEQYFQLQNYDKAIENYKLAIKYNKKLDYAYYNLGCVYLTKNDYNNARKSFESAIKINPKEPDYYYNLGFTYKKLNNIKRANKAITLYNELIKQRTEN